MSQHLTCNNLQPTKPVFIKSTEIYLSTIHTSTSSTVTTSRSHHEGPILRLLACLPFRPRCGCSLSSEGCYRNVSRRYSRLHTGPSERCNQKGRWNDHPRLQTYQVYHLRPLSHTHTDVGAGASLLKHQPKLSKQSALSVLSTCLSSRKILSSLLTVT